jgi:hypothetical protein
MPQVTQLEKPLGIATGVKVLPVKRKDWWTLLAAVAVPATTLPSPLT